MKTLNKGINLIKLLNNNKNVVKTPPSTNNKISFRNIPSINSSFISAKESYIKLI